MTAIGGQGRRRVDIPHIAAKRVNHRIKRCQVHTPASLTAQENTCSTGCRIIQLLSKLSDLAPCGMEWHGQMMLCEDLLVVHQETALAVEWQSIRMSLIGEGRHDRLEQVVIVVAALLRRRHLVKVRLHTLNPA